MLVGSNENLPVGKCRRSSGQLVYGINLLDFEIGRCGEDYCLARLVGNEQLACNMGDRTPVPAFSHASLLHDLTCGDFDALEDSRFSQNIVMVFERYSCAYPLQVALLGEPEPLGSDVAKGVSAGFDC